VIVFIEHTITIHNLCPICL